MEDSLNLKKKKIGIYTAATTKVIDKVNQTSQFWHKVNSLVAK